MQIFQEHSWEESGPRTLALRKARMALPARGKSGGARVIYLYLPDNHVLYLFLLFKKSDTANLSKAQRNQLGALAEQIKSSYAQKKQNP